MNTNMRITVAVLRLLRSVPFMAAAAFMICSPGVSHAGADPAALLQDRTVPSQQNPDDEIIVNGGFRAYTPDEERIAEDRARQPLPGDRGGLKSFTIPAAYTGTGLSELIEYQIPSGYDPNDPDGYPMIVCWHRYAQGPQEVSLNSMIDEECENRQWIYLSIMGAVSKHFGYLTAQIHCTKAIDYMRYEIEAAGVKGVNIDTNRIYMAGCSMGGGAAMSYASRHLHPDEGYPVAGLILIASLYDWTHAYHSGDLGVQTHMPPLLGGTPSQVPFAYKQISSLFIIGQPSLALTYLLDQSMGQNTRHDMPVFITYAGNDPTVHMHPQHQVLKNMLDDIKANYMWDYYPFFWPNPHGWGILDINKSFDFISQYSLEDQATESITVLADRDATFYWARVTQHLPEAFSMAEGIAFAEDNTLDIAQAGNMDILNVDCDWTGLKADETNPLKVTFKSGSSEEQTLELQPVSKSPTYIVDGNGMLYPDSIYSTGDQKIAITRPPSKDLDLKISFEGYNLTLSGPGTVKLGDSYALTLRGGEAFDQALLFFSFNQVEFAINQNHHLLLNPFVLAFWYPPLVLDASGGLTLPPITVPNLPELSGETIHQQFLTHDTAVKEISNLVSTALVE